MARRDSPGHDPSRREFFRTFSRQTVQNAGAVAGAAAELRRTSLAAARELLDTQPLEPGTDDRATVVTPVGTDAAPDASFRSAYRFTGESLVLLDQRELPDRVLTFECHDAAAVASAVRSGAIATGPVLAEVAAYAIVLAATSAADRTEASREQRVRAACGALRAARREQAALVNAVDRMETRYDSAPSGTAAGAVVDELRAEADAIALDAVRAHAEMGQALADHLRRRADEADSIDVLVHGDTGPLSHGLVGPSTAAFAALVADDRSLHAWVTHAAPSDEGVRITAHTLSQHDVAHTVIPDTAVGWLLANRRIAAAIVRGDTVLQGGDVLALVGTRSVAVLAHDADTPFFVLAPRAAHDRNGTADTLGGLAPRSAAESGGARRARLNPLTDVVPARLVTTVISESAGGQ